MNIKKAKKQIRDALELYLMEDKWGGPCIPESEQRPIVLMGPPGIGKTAIVSQLAEEMELAFVSYSMTHHTRQSALGLPEISTKEYAGRVYTVTDYTMSEIIASVFEAMERTGISRGILFLDEINCVSETLVPAMLQFLQFRTFGRQQILGGPEGRRTVRERERIAFLDEMTEYEDGKEAFLQRTAALDERAEAEGRKLTEVFSFSEKVWGEGQEMLLLMSELTADPYASAFIGLYGSPDYRRHSELLSFGERGSEIRKEIRALRTL